MHAYPTAGPITVVLDVAVANISVTAADRADTVVEVRPTDASKEGDVKAAAEASVDYADGLLTITTPRKSTFKRGYSADITIALPAGSHLRGKASVGELKVLGRVGDVDYRTQTGAIAVEDAATVRLHTRTGQIDIGKVAEAVTAETENGNLRIVEVVAGSVHVTTHHGHIDVGVHQGSDAAVDVNADYGKVRNTLTGRRSGRGTDITVHARAGYGDISLHRSSPVVTRSGSA